MLSNINFTLLNAKMRTLTRTTHNTYLPIFILAICFSIFSTRASAQDVKMGLALAPNVSWMTPIDSVHTSDGVGGNFGFEFIIDFMLTEKLAFSTGVHVFDTKGTINYLDPEFQNEQGFDYINSVSRDYDLKYVEIPLSLKARTKQIGYTTIYGQVGLGLGLNIGVEALDQRQKEYMLLLWGWESFDDQYLLPSSPAVQNDIKLLRSSLILGLGVEHSLGESYSLIIGANYNSGLLNIHKGTEQILVDENGAMQMIDLITPETVELKGNDSFVELVIGLIF
jgi:hypothetical protein